MADLVLSSIDMASVRLQPSRAVELALSVRVLQHDPTGLHRAFVRTTRERLAARPDLDVRVLAALVPPSGTLADVLTPALPAAATSLEQEVAAVRAMDPALLVTDVDVLLGLGASPGATDVLLALRGDPAAGLVRVADAMTAYWEVALADHWPTVRRVLDADVARRSRHLAAHGVGSLFAELSPRVRMRSDRLRIETSCRGDDVIEGGRGLVLTPSVFCQPRGLVMVDEPYVPTVIYHALGVGNLWCDEEIDAEHALDDALGRTRTQLLRAIGVPASTTELAGVLGLSAATVSEHLAILRRAGLARSTREGRVVLYGRTAAADVLLRAAEDA